MPASAKPGAHEAEALIQRWARWIVGRNLVTPAVALLELLKPLSFLGSQLLWILEPLWGQNGAAYARLLEDRANIERLLQAIESQVPGAPAQGREEDPCHL